MTKEVRMRVDPNFKRKLKSEAAQIGMSMVGYTRYLAGREELILVKYLKNNNKQNNNNNKQNEKKKSFFRI